MRASRRGRAPRSEGSRGALVRPKPPASGHRLVDRPADQRMAEAKSPRDIRRPDHIQREQLVERIDRRRLRHTRRRAGQVGIERVTGDRCALQHATRTVREQGELLRERRHHRARNVDAADRELERRGRRARPSRARARELLEVERVAAALLIEAGHRVAHVAEQLVGLAAREGDQLETSQAPARCARSSPADSRSPSCRGRAASASSTGAAGGRCNSAPNSSTDA